MAIIGAGPAGFYTAYRVLGKLVNVKVDMYESLPVPYGLARFGVAPDHPEAKVCPAYLFPFVILRLADSCIPELSSEV